MNNSLNVQKSKWLFSMLGISILLLLIHVFPSGVAYAEESPEIVFGYHQTSFSWGPVQRGWYLNDQGQVSCYQLTGRRAEEWKNPDERGYISKEDLLHNYQLTTGGTFAITPTIVQEKIAVLKLLARSSTLSDPVQQYYDAGDVVYAGYLWNSQTKQYQRIILARRGDFCQDNVNPFAMQLTEWLADIQRRHIL